MFWLLVILIIGILVIRGIVEDNKKFAEIAKKEQEKEENIKKRYGQASGYFNEGYATRPIVTGDYFLSADYTSYQDGDYVYSHTDYLYCRNAKSAICANCSRRSELHINGQYYYGASSACEQRIKTHY